MYKLQQGFTLLEVLVSLILISFMLFEFDGMQIAALKHTQANYFFHIASNELDAMYERLYALKNKQGLTDLVASWQAQIKTELPNAQGEVSGVFPTYKISIAWGDKQNCNETHIGFSGCLLQEFQL